MTVKAYHEANSHHDVEEPHESLPYYAVASIHFKGSQYLAQAQRKMISTC